MIELKKVTKSYGAQKVLDDITVTLERGAYTALWAATARARRC